MIIIKEVIGSKDFHDLRNSMNLHNFINSVTLSILTHCQIYLYVCILSVFIKKQGARQGKIIEKSTVG